MARLDIIETIKRRKIIAIVRGVSSKDIKDTVKALYEGGIRLIEVTFNQADTKAHQETVHCIKLISGMFEDMSVGAGTVMNPIQVAMAHEAGTKYIISPNCDHEVIKKTKELGMVSIPGAFTPTEIVNAYSAGADFVKIFPAGQLGTDYIKSILSPLNHIPLLAVGGIDNSNLAGFMKTGICGVGIGGNLVSKTLIKEGKFVELTQIAMECVNAVEQ